MQKNTDKSVDPHNFFEKTEINDWLSYLLLLTTDQLILLHHNMNRFKPFVVKSNDPNSINSPKSHFWDIFGHIGHLLSTFLPFWAKFPHARMVADGTQP